MLFRSPAPPGVTPEIRGVPKVVAIGQELRLSVVGLTTPPLGDNEVLRKWASNVELITDEPDGGESATDVELSLGIGSLQSVRFRIFYTPSIGGTHFLVLHDKNSGLIVKKRIVVGPAVPVPDPLVPPTPVVSGRRTILLVHEAQEVTPQMNRTELDLTTGDGWKYLVSKKHDMLILSDDRGIPTNYPAGVQAAFQKAKGLTLPSIAIIDTASSAELFVGPVDKNAKPDDILSIIKKYGG